MNRARKLGLAAALVAFGLLPLLLKSYGVYLATLWCVYLIAAFGLNLIVGYAGQMSIGQAAFFGIGAYVAAILMKAGIDFWFVLPVARSPASLSDSPSAFRRCASNITTLPLRRWASTCWSFSSCATRNG